MTPEEILDALNANVGKRACVTFDDGEIQSVLIDCVDEEGFLHSGPDGINPRFFWTRFEREGYSVRKLRKAESRAKSQRPIAKSSTRG